jgi:hypothetical protein
MTGRADERGLFSFATNVTGKAAINVRILRDSHGLKRGYFAKTES